MRNVLSETLKLSIVVGAFFAALSMLPADSDGTWSASHMDSAGNVYVDDSGLSFSDCLAYFNEGYRCSRD